MRYARIVRFALLPAALLVGSAFAETVLYNNDIPDGKIATVSGQVGGTEFESADDFLLTNPSKVTGGSFTGLLPSNAVIKSVSIEFYGVNRNEIAVRNVPTRVNSPTNDAILDTTVDFHTHTQNNGVGVVNSVDGTINPAPPPDNKSADSVTGGDGPRVGEEVRFEFTLPNSGFFLDKGQYFFVPKVELQDGSFLWLSASKPIGAFGSTPFAGDLQSWIRNDPGINPDWERIGRDVIGPDSASAQTYNASFRLIGTVVPEPTGIAMLVAGLVAVGAWSQRKRT